MIPPRCSRYRRRSTHICRGRSTLAPAGPSIVLESMHYRRCQGVTHRRHATEQPIAVEIVFDQLLKCQFSTRRRFHGTCRPGLVVVVTSLAIRAKWCKKFWRRGESAYKLGHERLEYPAEGWTRNHCCKSVAQVRGPTIPSGTRPWSRWN